MSINVFDLIAGILISIAIASVVIWAYPAIDNGIGGCDEKYITISDKYTDGQSFYVRDTMGNTYCLFGIKTTPGFEYNHFEINKTYQVKVSYSMRDGKVIVID